jgi:DNA helicase HerA-like ATPase
MINFGTDKWNKNNKIIWDAKRVVNGHFIIVGGSGSGKTFNLRKILREITSQDSSIVAHIIDVHGDIDVGSDITSTAKFSETSEVGLQPLKISEDLDFGGVRKKIRSLVAMVNNTTRKLGPVQETVFVNLLIDLYRAAGFYQEDSKTWSLDFDPRRNAKYKKQYPTMGDLKMFTKYKLEQIFTGSNTKAVHKLEVLNKTVKSIETALRNITKSQHDEDKVLKLEEKLEKLKGEAKNLYSEYIDSIKTGRELEDILKYDNMETIKRVYEKIDGMLNTGIFKSKKPDFDESKPVKRYDIKSLNKDEQIMFADILLEDIFMQAKERGEQESVNTFIIIDEAHIFINNEDTHIINVIMKEARKFGLGLILASQSFEHFSDDIIANSASKLILGIDEMFQEASAKKLRIEAKKFKYIIPKKSAMIQIKNSGSSENKFIDIDF